MGKRKAASVAETETEEKVEKSQKTEKAEAEDEEMVPEVKVVGEILKKAGGKLKGDKGRKLYQAFEVEGERYDVDDAVLVTPERTSQKPYVAIIKKIMQAKDGTVQVEGQWFYRPEEAEKKGGGTWASSDSRELFYSFHIDEVPAESVMHKCQVHFIPPNKQLPMRHKHPGFVVRRVYDASEKKLYNLTDKDYEDPMQKEIDLLVQKTRDALGDLPDLEREEAAAPPVKEEPEVKVMRRKVSVKRAMAPLNVKKTEEVSLSETHHAGKSVTTPGKSATPKSETTPTSTVGTDAEVSALLRTHAVLLGVHARDRWLEKLVQTIRELCGGGKGFALKSVAPGEPGVSKPEDGDAASTGREVQRRGTSVLGEGDLTWPEIAPVAVEVASALERLSHDSLGNDLHKYNLKMRQLDFNVKSNKVLSRRILCKELEPAKVINMTPAELKDGYIAAEREDQEPPEPETMQMADVRCSICAEREVGVVDIIHVGYGDRYQLECMKCGNTWYSSRDAISSLVIKTADAPPTVGIAPWATSKFDEVEKDIQSSAAAAAAAAAPDAAAAADHAPPAAAAAAATSTSPTDAKAAAAPTSHYAEVENILNEHLSVTNPVAEELLVQAMKQPPAAEETPGVEKPEVTPEEVEKKPQVDQVPPENPATNGTTPSVQHKEP